MTAIEAAFLMAAAHTGQNLPLMNNNKRFLCALLFSLLLSVESVTAMASDFRLQKSRNVQPDYPRSALSREIEGWVDLRVTVNIDGEVSDIEIVAAEPRRVFERAAIRAANRWEFVPPRDSGIEEPQQGVFRITFALE
jgi:TonB family protein